MIDHDRQLRVNRLAQDIISIVTSEHGITVEALRTHFPQDGHTAWDVSGALDIVTGFADKTRTNSPIEIQRGHDGERHLVLRESPPTYFLSNPLREWMP